MPPEVVVPPTLPVISVSSSPDAELSPTVRSATGATVSVTVTIYSSPASASMTLTWKLSDPW